MKTGIDESLNLLKELEVRLKTQQKNKSISSYFKT